MSASGNGWQLALPAFCFSGGAVAWFMSKILRFWATQTTPEKQPIWSLFEKFVSLHCLAQRLLGSELSQSCFHRISLRAFLLGLMVCLAAPLQAHCDLCGH
ncbi:MAG: hypothetical protein ACK4OE_16105 [Acidovorax sp.]